jgi:hypothetical protein
MFDLSKDPSETTNLATTQTVRFPRLRNRMIELHAEIRDEGPEYQLRKTKRKLQPNGRSGRYRFSMRQPSVREDEASNACRFLTPQRIDFFRSPGCYNPRLIEGAIIAASDMR